MVVIATLLDRHALRVVRGPSELSSNAVLPVILICLIWVAWSYATLGRVFVTAVLLLYRSGQNGCASPAVPARVIRRFDAPVPVTKPYRRSVRAVHGIRRRRPSRVTSAVTPPGRSPAGSRRCRGPRRRTSRSGSTTPSTLAGRGSGARGRDARREPTRSCR